MTAALQIGLFAVTTVGFAGSARLLRGVTTSGSLAGGAVCFVLMLAAGWGGFAALCSVFLLTWAATRLGYSRKQRLGTAERQGGRNAGQVLANLGVAAGAAGLYVAIHDPRFLAAVAAALAEVAADTLSSEVGLALGGTPRLATTWRQVSSGTNGGVTVGGTFAGVAGATLIVLVCVVAGVVPRRAFWACAGAGLLGMAADSLLGATVERRGILGNNGVNFLSTAIAAVIAAAFR
jgi:uncharacterized protein (TIGR00297 family)